MSMQVGVGATGASHSVVDDQGKHIVTKQRPRLSHDIDDAVFRQMQGAIQALTETVEHGEAERNQLLTALRSFRSLPACESTSTSTQTRPTHVDPAGSRPVSRPVSPSAFQRLNSATRGGVANGESRGGSGERNGDPWKWSFHGDHSGVDPMNRGYRELLADNRAMLITIDKLERRLRHSESESEQRMRRVQKSLTDSEEQCVALKERVLLLEADLHRANKELKQSGVVASGDLLGGSLHKYARTLSFKKV